MIYMIFYITGYMERDMIELNQLAREGWRVVCPYKDFGLIVGKEE